MSENHEIERIAANWHAVQHLVADAIAMSGRAAGSTKIVGVSKYVGLPETEMLIKAGCKTLGESRPQALWSKAESNLLSSDVQWHLIGHLQRNKIRRLLRHSVVIESIDSQRTLNAVAEISHQQQLTTQVLLEVNISGDEKKTGFAPEEMPQLMQNLPVNGIAVLGLMAMAGWGTDPDEARAQFEKTRLLRDRLRAESGLELKELSMGMSGDFPAAIAEGATIVRIGSRLFEGIR
ncbi:MAG: YggS family pyridoxal phosphate-dependent enzyme [Rubripirellula sp.]|jgi:pyridoxal phosphate enzyme (YggS family)|nr:YggS family pyridoxal phosphate-dependent enzyme [Planctomycetaceae bacterium]MDF1841838.1 YggS family pyridoxal phosphate-dependent enzyme [Rubripirellula sp.]